MGVSFDFFRNQFTSRKEREGPGGGWGGDDAWLWRRVCVAEERGGYGAIALSSSLPVVSGSRSNIQQPLPTLFRRPFPLSFSWLPSPLSLSLSPSWKLLLRGWLLVPHAIQHSQPARNQTRPSLRNRFFTRSHSFLSPLLCMDASLTPLPLCCLRFLRPRSFVSLLFFLLPPCELSSSISSLLTYVQGFRFALDD